MTVNAKVYQHLVEMYQYVADAADGGDPLPAGLLKHYNEGFKSKEVSKFYKDLVDNNPMNALI